MINKEYISSDDEQTEQIASEFAKTLTNGDVVALNGELGAGKTAFARGIINHFGYNGRVTSPTFAIANEYQTDFFDLVHFDMYRILSAEALWELGFDEYLDGNRILLIEWSENIKEALPEKHKIVSITYGQQPDTRIIKISEV